LEPDEVAAYVAGGLTPAVRGRLEQHMAACGACVAEVAAVARLAGPGRATVGGLAAGAAAAAAAAAVAGVLLLGPGLGRHSTPGEPPVRGTEPTVAVSAVAPADGEELRGAPEFVWRSVPGATTYRISVTRADGDSVWAATTRDTVVQAPEAASRTGAGSYYWLVDALLADGRSVAGSVREFRIGP
jgi:hypothetical protein